MDAEQAAIHAAAGDLLGSLAGYFWCAAGGDIAFGTAPGASPDASAGFVRSVEVDEDAHPPAVKVRLTRDLREGEAGLIPADVNGFPVVTVRG